MVSNFAELLSCAENAAELLKSLANPQRLLILCRLVEGPCAVAIFESELGLRQPSLSQNLGQLRTAGLVTTERVSRNIVYQLADPRIAPILGVLQAAMMGDLNAAALKNPVDIKLAKQSRDIACGVFAITREIP
jgi:ArsR family transcriptional regulator